LVANLYADRIGVWNRNLIDLRTRALIAYRSIVAEKDPAEEYAKFQEAGGENPFDYPELCL